MSKIPQILREDEQQILAEWMRDMDPGAAQPDAVGTRTAEQGT
jgi:hypothetical protein